MELTDELKGLFIRTADKLTGSARRVFMAQVTQMLGKGGQRRAEVELGWNRQHRAPSPGQGEPNSSSSGLGEIAGSKLGAIPRVVSSWATRDGYLEMRMG